MIIGKDGGITHVAVVDGCADKHMSVRTADGVWLDRAYKLEYHFSNKRGKLSPKFQNFSATGIELLQGISYAADRFRKSTSDPVSNDDLMFELRHISKSALIVWMSFYNPFGSPNLKELRKGHGDGVVDAVISARRGSKDAKQLVRTMISAYMFIKIRDATTDVKKLVITDFATVAETEIQRQINNDDWKNCPGFGKIWSTAAEFREALRNGILGCVYE